MLLPRLPPASLTPLSPLALLLWPSALMERLLALRGWPSAWMLLWSLVWPPAPVRQSLPMILSPQWLSSLVHMMHMAPLALSGWLPLLSPLVLSGRLPLLSPLELSVWLPVLPPLALSGWLPALSPLALSDRVCALLHIGLPPRLGHAACTGLSIQATLPRGCAPSLASVPTRCPDAMRRT
jgi:hypothetical protein